MYDEDFEMFRAEALAFAHNRNKTLIEKWCKDCGVTSPVGYDNNMGEGIMTIYTRQPGALIGKGGSKVDAFKADLEKEFNRKYRVKFVEVEHFVNITTENE